MHSVLNIGRGRDVTCAEIARNVSPSLRISAAYCHEGARQKTGLNLVMLYQSVLRAPDLYLTDKPWPEANRELLKGVFVPTIGPKIAFRLIE